MKTILKIIFAALLLPSSMLFSQAEEVKENNTQADSKNIFFIDSQNGFAADDFGKVIYKTSDGGKSWVNRLKPANWQIKEIRISSIEDKKSGKKKPNLRSGGSKYGLGRGFMPADDFAASGENVAEIKFALLNPGFVSIKIYNSNGKTIDELARSTFGAGLHKIKWNVSKFPGDIYYYSIVTNEFSETNKIITVK